MADLDFLRNVNNTFGHLAGDTVLIGVAHIIRETVGEGGTAGRFGGEEFSVSCPGWTRRKPRRWQKEFDTPSPRPNSR